MRGQDAKATAFGRSTYELDGLSLGDAVAKAADFGHATAAAEKGWNDARVAHYAWVERSRNADARIQRIRDARTRSRSAAWN